MQPNRSCTDSNHIRGNKKIDLPELQPSEESNPSSRSKFIQLFRIDELAHRQTSDLQFLDRLMISRESEQQRSKTDLKSDPQKFDKIKSREVGGENDIQSRCHQPKSIEIINRADLYRVPKNQLDSHSRPNSRRSFANDATQNSTRGVLFGPIPRILWKQPGIISKPRELSLKRRKINFCTRLSAAA